jgi:hypothetical protein
MMLQCAKECKFLLMMIEITVMNEVTRKRAEAPFSWAFRPY